MTIPGGQYFKKLNDNSNLECKMDVLFQELERLAEENEAIKQQLKENFKKRGSLILKKKKI